LNIPDEYGVELVSPVYTTSSIFSVHDDLHKIFATLHGSKHYTLLTTPRSSSHVHISRTTNPFSPTELAGVAKATLYFEQALNQLMPPARRDPESYWAKSNRSRNNPSLAGLSLAECLAKIDTAATAIQGQGPGSTSLRPIVEVMNLYSKNTNFARARGRRADFIRGKTYRWNLAGLLAAAGEWAPGEDMDCGGGLGTIEFRQPPGSLTAEEAMSWAALAVTFVAAAVTYGPELQGGDDTVMYWEEGGSLEQLWEFVKAGSLVLGWDDVESLRVLFQGAGLVVANVF
jgi:hypothetical protein